MNEKLFSAINEYTDGELKRQDEVFLFEQLAVDTEARNYFRKINLLKNELRTSDEELPTSLENKILKKVQSVPEREFSFRNSKFIGLITSVVSVILIVISILLLSEVSKYRNEIDSVIYQVKAQNKTIQALYNSLPPTEVYAVYSNEIIIKPKI